MDQKIKSRQLKDDAILNIKVNKTFYLMSKAALFNIFNELYTNKEMSSDEFVKSIVSKKYENMDNDERTFYTLSLLIGEIEKQAIETDAYLETEFTPEQLKEQLTKQAEQKPTTSED
tara:strand:+ start:2156 stop:2506 length:351 start_codon:yes stop_codon:yes gene_type:complete